MDDSGPLTNTDNDNNPSYPSHNTPSPFPYSLAHPASTENTYAEDSWQMDIDQDEHKDASSSSNITHPTFSDWSNFAANHPNAGHQTAPEKKYTRTYHQTLDSKSSPHLHSAVQHTESFHRQDL